MDVRGINAADLETIINTVSREHYSGNITTIVLEDTSGPRKGPAARFRLRTVDGTQDGAQGAASWNSSGTGPNGLRRTVSACFHAHWDVIAAIFRAVPDARVNTALANYTRETFIDRAFELSYRNVGSMVAPITAPELCECVGHVAHGSLNAQYSAVYGHGIAHV